MRTTDAAAGPAGQHTPRCWRPRKVAVGVVTLAATWFVSAFATRAQAETIVERYDRASRFAAWNAETLLSNADLKPQWSRDGRALWYVVDSQEGREVVVRRADDGRILHKFDSDRFLASLAGQTQLAASWNALNAATPELSGDGRRFALTSQGKRYWCELATLACAAKNGEAGAQASEAISPDGRRAVFVRQYNLWVRDLQTGAERQLTTDGAPYRAYASPTERAAGIFMRFPVRDDLPPAVVWSPDSRRLVTVKVDQTELPWFSVVDQVPTDSLLPKVHTFRYGFATEPGQAHEELYVGDVVDGTLTRIEVATQPLGFDSTIFMRRAWWSADGQRLAIAIFPLSERWADLYSVDPASGAATRIHREESKDRVLIAGELQYPPPVALLSDGSVVWYSTRSGFGHLYRLDGATGRVLNAITNGPWPVHRLLFVDERAGWLYFLAGGDTYGPEPYFANVYRVRFDGSKLTRLTPEAGDHQVATQFIGLGAPPPPTTQGFSPDGRHFVDAYSSPLDPEVTVLRAADGRVVAELARARLSPVVATRYKKPERFVVPAPEGREALHGLLMFPSDFDPSRKYPVIDAIYNGSQVVEHPRRFARTVFGEAQSLAELGFIVVIMDARGTPLRSQAFLDFAADHADQVGSIGDHVHAIRRLAEARPYMDLERVGLTGTSNGGYAALRGLLAYPDFFKVGVAVNGSHDLRKYMAAPSASSVKSNEDAVEALRHRANQEFATNLRGKLLMILGGFDTNVPLAASFGVAQALIDAGKNFDVVVVPQMGHEMSYDRFAIRKQWDYFVQHLRGEAIPDDYKMPFFAAQPADRVSSH